MYSTTYLAEIIKLASVFALLLGFEIDTEQLEVTLGVLFVVATSIWTLYQRWKAGGINAFGIRKK